MTYADFIIRIKAITGENLMAHKQKAKDASKNL